MARTAKAREQQPTELEVANARADRIKFFQLLALSFAALFLELMVIRWVPCVIRFVAYYANLLLISSFLGLGIGAMLSARGWRLFRWFPLLLAIYIGALLLSQPVTMPGSASEIRFYLLDFPLVSYGVLTLIFALNAALFVPLGEKIGSLFEELPNLRAYSWDLVGSLLGTLAFGFFSLRYFSPIAGFAIVMLVYLTLARGKLGFWAAALFIPTLAGIYIAGEPGARWSPYHYITIHTENEAPAGDPLPEVRTMRDPPMYSVRVNQDFYQQHGTIDLARYTPGTAQAQYVQDMLHNPYTLPYAVHPNPQRVLVVGAGGGLDVEAALLSGAQHVDAAEIDKELVALSRRFSASGVYDDPRVKVHINDARAFFREAQPGYDVIIFGFLDSQALFSYGTNIRLDGYIYTVQSIRTAWSLLDENGMLSISFVTPEPWLASKLQRMVEEATGRQPIAYAAGIQLILLAPRGAHAPPPPQIGRFVLSEVSASRVKAPTDDWPYLYLSKPAIPDDYLLVIGTLVVLSLACVLLLRRGSIGFADGHFFFMGVGFLLLQTKSISDCALYFGATWFVTMLVIAGVLLMVLAANLVAIRWKSYNPWLYLPLIAVVVILLIVPRERVLGWAFEARLAWTLLAVPLPVFFAGLIFSTTFRTARSPSAKLGSNLVGATIGGFAEYMSMATGLRALALVVIATYLASLACYSMFRRTGA